jgi:hypothetical protein
MGGRSLAEVAGAIVAKTTAVIRVWLYMARSGTTRGAMRYPSYDGKQKHAAVNHPPRFWRGAVGVAVCLSCSFSRAQRSTKSAFTRVNALCALHRVRESSLMLDYEFPPLTP